MTRVETHGTEPMIGLIGGLGVGAAIHYYRELAGAHRAAVATGDGLPGVDVVRSQDSEIDFIHGAYTRLAYSGIASPDDRRELFALAERLRTRDGVEAVLLAGADFAVMFDASNTTFPHVDCARAHIDAILAVA